MSKLRAFLCGSFGFLASVFLFISISTVPKLLPFSHAASSVLATRGIVAMLVDKLILSMPLVLAVCCGMAWWRVKAGKRSGRGWAIAASLALLLLSIPLMIGKRGRSTVLLAGADV
jgi:hypothetical protein